MAQALPFNADFFPKSHSLEVEQAPTPVGLSDCSSSQGRVFDFSSSVSFRLGGVALFFFEDYNSQNSILDASRIKLSVYSGAPESLNALIFRAPFQNNDSSYSKALSLYGNGQAKGVFFELPSPIWLTQSKTYSMVVECNNSSGSPQKIYGGNTTGARQFDSGAFTTGSEATSKVPYFQLYSKNDGQVLVVPPLPTPPLRPVIFVHGLGGVLSDFSGYTSLLLSQSWSSENVVTFDFGLKSDGSYNSWSGLNNLLPGLRIRSVTLAASYKARGGDGKIDLVAYSSGSVLARNYLGQYKGNSLVRKFIAIGGIFKGSFLADLENGNENFPGSGSNMSLSLGKVLHNPLKALNLLTMGRVPSDDSFKGDLKAASGPVLKFQKSDLPADVSYYSLRGEIKARNSQKLFKTSVTSEGSLGDGASLSASANDLPSVSTTSFDEAFDLPRSFTRQTATVSASLTIPDLSKLKYLHSNLLEAAEIKSRVLEILKN